MIRWVRAATFLAALAAVLALFLHFDSGDDLEIASQALGKKDPDLALRFAGRALFWGGLEPDGEYAARRVRVLAAQKLKNPAFALAELGRMAALDPKRAETFFLRGEMHLAAEDFAAALADFERGLALYAPPAGGKSRDLALRHAQRGLARFGAGLVKGAGEDRDQALALQPALPEGLHLSSLVLEKEGRIAEALAAMEEAYGRKESGSGDFFLFDPRGQAWLHRVVELRMKAGVDPQRPMPRY